MDHATTPEMVGGLRALLTWTPAAMAGVWDARDTEADGVWVRVGFIANPVDNPPVQNVPARPLPDATPAPPCVSKVPPSVDYVPAAAPEAPVDTGGLALGFGLAAITAAVVVRSATKMSA